MLTIVMNGVIFVTSRRPDCLMSGPIFVTSRRSRSSLSDVMTRLKYYALGPTSLLTVCVRLSTANPEAQAFNPCLLWGRRSHTLNRAIGNAYGLARETVDLVPPYPV